MDKNIIKEDEVKKQIITKQSLEAVSYHELKAKFEEIGVPDVWQAGKKKDVLINAAMSQLATLKKLRESGIKEDDLTEKVQEIEQKELDKKALKEAITKELAEKEALEKASDKKAVLKKRELSKEDIINNIKTIDANIRGGVASQRKTLFDKKNLLKAEFLSRFKTSWDDFIKS